MKFLLILCITFTSGLTYAECKISPVGDEFDSHYSYYSDRGVSYKCTPEEYDAIRPKLEAEQKASEIWSKSDAGKKELQNRAVERQKQEISTSCIEFGTAYRQAASVRDNQGVDSYNTALVYIKSMLSKYPQFDAKVIVDNVYYNPDYRYPAGGFPLFKQMNDYCMSAKR